jgi:hypothetical protein
MKNFAFKTHVACYTQSSASVCNLPVTDWQRIVGIIDNAELFDSYGATQILEVVKTCIAQYGGNASAALKMQWDKATIKLNGYLGNWLRGSNCSPSLRLAFQLMGESMIRLDALGVAPLIFAVVAGGSLLCISRNSSAVVLINKLW